MLSFAHTVNISLSPNCIHCPMLLITFDFIWLSRNRSLNACNSVQDQQSRSYFYNSCPFFSSEICYNCSCAAPTSVIPVSPLPFPLNLAQNNYISVSELGSVYTFVKSCVRPMFTEEHQIRNSVRSLFSALFRYACVDSVPLLNDDDDF